MFARAAVAGVAGGLAGTAVMTVAEKLEQAVTKRPDSYVPARTLAHLLRLSKPDQDRWSRNMAMHYGTGGLVDIVRAVMAQAGMNGPKVAVLFTPLRLAVDQTLENATGVGTPPWTWPREELVIDLAHKAVYALATGAVVDRLGRGRPVSRRAATSRAVASTERGGSSLRARCHVGRGLAKFGSRDPYTQHDDRR
jgi:hypothetical protein